MTGRSHRNAPATGGKVPQFFGIGQAGVTLVIASRASNTTILFAVSVQTFEDTASEFRRDRGLNGPSNTPTPVHSTSSDRTGSCLFVTFSTIMVNESLIIVPN
jgi:hypothetical protein